MTTAPISAPRKGPRSVLLAAGLALAALAASACGSAQPPPGGAGGGVQQNVVAQIDQSAAVAAGPVGQNLPDTPTIRAIRARGTLVMGGAHSTIGFSLQDPMTGKISGFDAGMGELLAKYILGQPKMQINSGASDNREALLGNHTVDVAIETYTITATRAKLVNFAGPYYMAASGIVVPKASTDINSVADLAGKQVATQSGAARDALMAAQPAAQPVLFDTTAQCLAAVQQGRVAAVALNNATLLGAVTRTPDLKLLDSSFGSSPFGIGLPLDDPQFKMVVNQFLRTIEQDGTWAKLWTDTVGKLAGGSPPAPPAIGSVPGS